MKLAQLWQIFTGWLNPGPTLPEPLPTPPAPTLNETLLDSHNKFRDEMGLSALQLDEDLTRDAQDWANWMGEHTNLAHEGAGTTVESRAEDHGFKPWSALGENIALGYASPSAVIMGWMHSPPHRKNILNPSFTRVGFGMAGGKDGRLYWCADFGTRTIQGMYGNAQVASLSGPLVAT